MALFAAGVSAALFSPRLWVRTVRIEGHHTVRTQRIFDRLRLREGTNIVRVPIDILEKAVEAEPAVAGAQVRRRWPATVVVRVWERVPWAVVKTRGIYYTVDKDLVPFRKERTLEPGLPVIVLDRKNNPVQLGKQMIADGLSSANDCLKWAKKEATFPVAFVRVDQTGSLCLNRQGGTKIYLGSGRDLDKKLHTLNLLMLQRADVRGGHVRYVRLVAFDAPAIFPGQQPQAPRDRAPIDPTR